MRETVALATDREVAEPESVGQPQTYEVGSPPNLEPGFHVSAAYAAPTLQGEDILATA